MIGGVLGRRALLTLAGLLAALAVAFGASEALALRAATTVRVQLKEFKVILSTSQVKAGKVVFLIQNVGKIDHEFVVLKTGRAPGALPVKGATAVEEGRVAKIPPFKAGLTKVLTLDLKPGRYVLICNVPAHYKAGQFAGFRAG